MDVKGCTCSELVASAFKHEPFSKPQSPALLPRPLFLTKHNKQSGLTGNMSTTRKSPPSFQPLFSLFFHSVSLSLPPTHTETDTNILSLCLSLSLPPTHTQTHTNILSLSLPPTHTQTHTNILSLSFTPHKTCCTTKKLVKLCQ